MAGRRYRRVAPPLCARARHGNRRRRSRPRRRLQQGKTHEGLHALLWPVSRLLVRFIEAHAAEFAGARVLELGAGVVRSEKQMTALSRCPCLTLSPC